MNSFSKIVIGAAALVLIGIGFIVAKPETPTSAVSVAPDSGEIQKDSSPRPAAPRGAPNIIFILTDDLDRKTFNPKTMPRTFRFLKKRGTTFDKGILPVPTCCPSRANFMSGQYDHNNGVLSNGGPRGGIKGYYQEDRRKGIGLGYNIGSFLQNGGYRTTFIGKYLNTYGDDYIEGEPETSPRVIPGWDRWFVPIQNRSQKFYNFRVRFNGVVLAREDVSVDTEGKVALFEAPHCSEGGCSEDEIRRQKRNFSERVFVDQVIGSLKSGKRPKFIWYSTDAPHGTSDDTIPQHSGSWGGPEFDPRDRFRFQGLKENLRDERSFDEWNTRDKPKYIQTAPRISGDLLKKTRAHRISRWRSMYSLDRELGRLYRYLQVSGKAKNTILIFTSDNGYMNGEHRVPKGKIVPYREANEFPVIFRGPGIKRGQVVRDSLAANVDLVPTVLSLAGLRRKRVIHDPISEARRPLDGINLAPWLRGDEGVRRPAVPIASTLRYGSPIFQPYRGVRSTRYSFVRYYRENPRSFYDCVRACYQGIPEFYDLRTDPEQLRNLVPVINRNRANPAWRSRHARLLRAYRQHIVLANRLKDCSGSACVKPVG